jgi:hypothetical protein
MHYCPSKRWYLPADTAPHLRKLECSATSLSEHQMLTDVPILSYDDCSINEGYTG